MFGFSLTFYDEKKCKEIISKYTGDKKTRILRALADGRLKPSDIKRYYICGHSGIPPSQSYLLINHLIHRDKSNYKVNCFDSGCGYSVLDAVELEIKNGEAVINEHWVCA